VVTKKNRTARTRNCYNVSQPAPVIDRRRPGENHRHVITKSDMERFIGILPDWDEISKGLHVIVIDSGDQGCMGWCGWGSLAVCAWERELVWTHCSPEFGEDHEEIFQKLAVPYKTDDEYWTVEWTKNLARAFLLTHVFVHELGHHHDRMTTRSKQRICRGESYAEQYARDREDVIIDRYFNEFGM